MTNADAGALHERPRWITLLATWGPPIAILIVLALSVLVLHHELRTFRYHDIAERAKAIPRGSLILAGVFTIMSYLTLPSYDTLGLTYAGKRPPLHKVAFASVIAYGLSHTLGFPLLTGGSVHYRFWSSWGLTNEEIAQAASFSAATFVIGSIFLTGAALLLEPVSFHAVMGLPDWVFRPVGILCLLLTAAYLVMSIFVRAPLRIKSWQFPSPTPKLAIAQIIVSTIDWTVAGAALYALLPHSANIGFWQLIGAYILAHAAGLVLHIPGGLGVFETIMLVFLRPVMEADVILGTLVVYRIIYYIIPFACALGMITGSEIHRQRTRVAAFATGVASAATRWVPAVLPTTLSTCTFAAGALLLFSSATPEIRARVAILTSVFPLGVVEAAHFIASLAGAGLIVLAWGARRRLDAAYALIIALLGVSIVAALLRGLDWEEALLLAAVLGVVIPSRRAFYRKATLLSEPFEANWIAAIIAVTGATIWFGQFSYKRVDYSSSLWWQFDASADAPRFLRGIAGAATILVIFAAVRLLRHQKVVTVLPTGEDILRATAIIQANGNSHANLALLGDKALLFSESGNAFLMYGIQGASWIAMGDPVGPKSERHELAWRFNELADGRGARAAFYEVSDENLPLYIDLGLSVLKLGEEAVVPLAEFSLDSGQLLELRRSYHDAAREGATLEVLQAEQVGDVLPVLREISASWMVGHKTPERGFSVGRFDEQYLSRLPVAIVRIGTQPVAFASLWVGGREELSVDFMRFRPDAPPHTMDFLMTELIHWGRAREFARFSLGLSPVEGPADQQLAPLLNTIGPSLFRHGEHFYNFEGLRMYKEKFAPRWEPRFFAAASGVALARVLANVASATTTSTDHPVP